MLVKQKNDTLRLIENMALLQRGIEVVNQEAAAVASLASKIDDNFTKACLAILNCNGRVVVSGMGKSGHIASKIAATLASTGTPSFFVHPAEASHGDLGMISASDIVMVFSYTGETHELITILPLIKRLGVDLIALTGNSNSTLAKMADIHINVAVSAEACSLGLAPTASTTASMAMGDAMAIAILEARGFTAEDFARSHPGGSLGRRLLFTVSDIMRVGEQRPIVDENVTIADALLEMSKKCLGITAIVSRENGDKVVGVFTDGDLRRTLSMQVDLNKTKITEVMSRKFHTINPDAIIQEAVHMMEEFEINAIPVIDDNNKLVGAFNMHDLLKTKLV